MSIANRLNSWPLVRQLTQGDPLGLGKSVQSKRSQELRPRTEDSESVARSICPYCAVGCAQLVYVKEGEITHIEGDPASPVSRGRLCPKGQATRSFATSPLREYKVKYRPPHGKQWQELPLNQAMEMIAERLQKTRLEGWQEEDDQGRRLNRTKSVAHLGGATLDNEENYLIKKLFTALGAIQIENQARI
jgi:formate dehydrogenase major subunit